MQWRKPDFASAVFLTSALVLCVGTAHAQTQYAYPAGPYTTTSTTYTSTSPPTYQTHYPAALSSSSAVYPNNPPQYQAAQYQPAPQYQPAQPQPQPAPQYQPSVPAYGGGVESLPSYSYNQNLDPRYQPTYKAAGATTSPSASSEPPQYQPYMGLETRSGLDLGAQLAYYRYSEPSLGVTETSDDPFLGIDVRGTYAFGRGYFLRGEGRYAFTDIDYEGSGEIDGRLVDTWEWRALFGKDFMFQTFDLSPYAGFGYRTLFNDNRGATTAGAEGYRRYNQLYYIPIGIEPRMHIDSNARFSSMLEYDAVIHGLQKSDLGDDGLGDPPIKNSQSNGFGLRGEAMYETRTWSFGPYFTYWSIGQSSTKDALDYSSVTCGGLGTPCIIEGDEPANHTIEVGLQFRYHFF